MNLGDYDIFKTLPIRAYLDETVIPIILNALSALAQESVEPENPIEYIADFLFKHNPENAII